MGQRVKLRLSQGETDSVEIRRGVRQGCYMSPILFILYGEYLIKGILADFFINKVRFADDTAIIAKTQEELQDMANRLVDAGRKYGMEINIDKSQVMRVSRSNESLRIKVNNRELKEVDHSNSLKVCQKEMVIGNSMDKEAFKRKMPFLTSKQNILTRFYVWFRGLDTKKFGVEVRVFGEIRNLVLEKIK